MYPPILQEGDRKLQREIQKEYEKGYGRRKRKQMLGSKH